MTVLHSEIPRIRDDHPAFERWWVLTGSGHLEADSSTSAMTYLVRHNLTGEVMLDSRLHGRRITIRRNTDGSWTPVNPVDFEKPDDYGEP